MPAVVTNEHRIVAADYFQNDLSQIPTYVWIGGTSQWLDENTPPNINDTVSDKVFSYDELVGMKRIQIADVISVVPRINWASNAVFDEYRDDVNLIDDKNPETDEFYKFYVITDEFNVYKCLSNNNRSPSTVKPSGTTINTFQTPDGYTWKYMYTVRSSDAFEYMTPNWIPCYTLYTNDGSSQWLVQTSATKGTIDHIYVTDGGANYVSTNPPTVTITGDGTGAAANVEIDDESGTITKIIVTDPGQDYTTASVSIDSNGDGVGATATPVVSPINGHGSDARSELGAVYKMIRVVFQESEGGILPTGIEYRKAGVISEPLSTDTGVTLSVLDPKFFQVGEVITGDTSGATGTIRSINSIKNYLYIESVSGAFNQGELVSSQTYNSTEVVEVFSNQSLPLVNTVVASSDFSDNTGNMLYMSTREKISRGANQNEEIRFVIQF